MQRDTTFTAIAYSTDTPVTVVSKKAYWAENVLARARVDGERVDINRGSGLADDGISEAGSREIQ